VRARSRFTGKAPDDNCLNWFEFSAWRGHLGRDGGGTKETKCLFSVGWRPNNKSSLVVTVFGERHRSPHSTDEVGAGFGNARKRVVMLSWKFMG
jgi:hypothetical protein